MSYSPALPLPTPKRDENEPKALQLGQSANVPCETLRPWGMPDAVIEELARHVTAKRQASLIFAAKGPQAMVKVGRWL